MRGCRERTRGDRGDARPVGSLCQLESTSIPKRNMRCAPFLFSSKGISSTRRGSEREGEWERKKERKVLTEILSDVQQDSRGSSVQLVKQGAETEEEQRSHAETITSQGEAQRRGGEEAVLSVVPLSGVVGSRAVAVKGTAAEILHHLLLTRHRGKSPIRPWRVKRVARRPSVAAVVVLETRGHAAAVRGCSALGSFVAHRRRLASARPLSSALVGMNAPSFRPSSGVKGPSSCSVLWGVRLLDAEGGKTSTSRRRICVGA